jgi:hypothetical protein
MTEPKVGTDLLWGVKAIAAEIGLSERVTYWQLETGLLPAGKSGNTWVASRQNLRKHFLEITAERRPHGKTGATVKAGKTIKAGIKKAATA